MSFHCHLLVPIPTAQHSPAGNKAHQDTFLQVIRRTNVTGLNSELPSNLANILVNVTVFYDVNTHAQRHTYTHTHATTKSEKQMLKRCENKDIFSKAECYIKTLSSLK